MITAAKSLGISNRESFRQKSGKVKNGLTKMSSLMFSEPFPAQESLAPPASPWLMPPQMKTLPPPPPRPALRRFLVAGLLDQIRIVLLLQTTHGRPFCFAKQSQTPWRSSGGPTFSGSAKPAFCAHENRQEVRPERSMTSGYLRKRSSSKHPGDWAADQTKYHRYSTLFTPRPPSGLEFTSNFDAFRLGCRPDFPTTVES